MDHKAELGVFYRKWYPENWFDSRMLEIGQYIGIRDAGRLVSVAGIRVFSRENRVAALGNTNSGSTQLRSIVTRQPEQ